MCMRSVLRANARVRADINRCAPVSGNDHYRLTVDESEVEGMGIQEVFRCLIEDEGRNLLIAEKALAAMAAGRSPVLLTERTKHLEWFRDYLSEKVDCLIVLHGGMGVKQRRAAWEALKETAESGAPRLVLATGKYLGEGFDDARLDTLLLAMPVSWKGTVAQYAGRLHRLFADKRTVMIYDFLDDSVPVLGRMFERRKKGYAAIGYTVEGEGGIAGNSRQTALGLDGGAGALRS